MKIKKENLKTLWYEDKEGNIFIPDLRKFKGMPCAPKGFVYHNSIFPTQLRHSILKLTEKEEVEKCSHIDYVIPTYGWVDGIEGRKCTKCNGSQTREVGSQWPEKWEACGSTEICAINNGWDDDLALAMAIKRKPKFLRNNIFDFSRFTLSESIIICATTCERCMNVLRYHYLGRKYGYKEYSKEWNKTCTSCDFCS